jgi:hypothetical protein
MVAYRVRSGRAKGRPLSRGTVNEYVSIVQRMLSWGVEE